MTLLHGFASYSPGTRQTPVTEEGDRWGLNMTLAGHCEWRLPACGSAVHTTTGDLMLFQPHVATAWLVPAVVPGKASQNNRQWRTVWFVFDPDDRLLSWLRFPQIGEGVQRLALQPGPHRRRVSAALMDALRMIRGAVPGRQDLAMNALERAILWARSAHLQELRPMDERTRAALQYVQDHLDDPDVQLHTIVRACHTSQTRLVYLFKHDVGVSLMHYLERTRIRRAEELLASSALSVKEVAAAVGYRDPDHFSRRFRHVTARSPREAQRSAG